MLTVYLLLKISMTASHITYTMGLEQNIHNHVSENIEVKSVVMLCDHDEHLKLNANRHYQTNTV